MSAMMEKLSAALEDVCEDSCLPRDTSIAVRAVLTALIEPSDEMCDAGTIALWDTASADQAIESYSSLSAFIAMINAVLEGRA